MLIDSQNMKAMKDFLKFTFATVIGIIIASVLLSIISIVSLASIAASSQTEVNIKENSVLKLKFNGTLTERSSDNPFTTLLSEDFTTQGLDDILASIKKAKESDKIKGIYIENDYLNASFASLEEIRNALSDFKKSGKFIISYADNYSQGLYYLSSIADKIILNPQGTVEWKGLASAPIFYKTLLEKLGIEMQIFKVGAYKSAVEPYTSTQISQANEEQITSFLNSIWKKILGDVSMSRNIPINALNQYADQAIMLDSARRFVETKLVDTLLYKNEAEEYLRAELGLEAKESIPTLNVTDAIHISRNVPKDKSGNIIAVYYAHGDIDGATEDNINSQKTISDLKRLREDENVKAVVLRVNSPGGSAYGSEQIWHEVRLLKQQKPVIASMGDYAASGGYYISCAADSIIAQATTLTGSIGIFGIIPNLNSLADKIGVNFDIVKTNRFSDFAFPTRQMTDEEKNIMQMNINQGYRLFIQRCAEGRGMAPEAIEKVAEGRVWTGAEAQKLGLVDQIGGIDLAIATASSMAGIESYTILEYPEKKSFLASIMEDGIPQYLEAKIKEDAGYYYECLHFIRNIEKQDRVQARLPFYLRIQ